MSLFPTYHDLPAAAQQTGPFAAVAMEQAIDRLLDYSIPARLVPHLKVGQRVKVPLGRSNRSVRGYVVEIRENSEFPKLKPILDIDDSRVLFSPKMMELALWMSKYYVAPLGLVLESVIPSAVKKKTGLGYQTIVRPAKSREQLQEILESIKHAKRRAILARLLLVDPAEGINLMKLATESGVTSATIRKLRNSGWINLTEEADIADFSQPRGASGGNESDIQLNEDQKKVYDELAPRVAAGGFSVNLILGVTGSGKTEVYLQTLRQVVAAGKQAIVLVPEIALTPQTVRRFTARFPRVAVLHSGLTQTQRHQFWQQIAAGEAQVVVGARSAVFAPVKDLGVIVIDEEHEASYKQDTSPRYHARDVAVMRAHMEKVPIVLGSATPSLEMYHRICSDNASGKYHLYHLPRRVRGLEMPKVELIDLKNEFKQRKGVHLLSVRLEGLLRSTLAKGEQAILLLNRRGYSNFVYCASCQEAIQCKFCDATMTYHRSAGTHVDRPIAREAVHTGQLHCHYCLAVNPLPDLCPACGKKLSLFGLGTQRVEEELNKKFPDVSLARVDSDTMRSSKDYEATLNRFAKKEIQLLLGTQMIAKGLDFPNVTLVGVVSGDTALSLPDFRSSERTFQLITQVAGRAGRGDIPGRVILQTFQPDDNAIQFALKQDFPGFAAKELENRKQVGLPPFSRMVRIVIRDIDQDKLHKRTEDLAMKLAEAVLKEGDEIRMKGPMPCPIARISGYHRNQVVMFSPSVARLQRVLEVMRDAGHLAINDRVAVDVDPVSLL